MTRPALALLPAVLLAAAFSACGGEEAPAGDMKLRVVATTTQIGDFAANVGGDRISLTVLLKANQDAHDFAPSPSQIKALNQADVVLRNGLGLDAFVTKAIGAGEDKVVVVTEGIALRGGPSDANSSRVVTAADDSGVYDPHVWFSVANAMTMVETIRETLVRADETNAAIYRENASRYLARLAELDGHIRAQVSQVPPACRKLVTNHDTIGYYAEAYGFTVVGSVIAGTSTEAKPSASDFADIVRKIREEKVPAIFAEASLNPDLIRQVAREAGVKVVDDLYGDSLGPKGSDAATYIQMMETNTRKIVDALKDCTA